MGIIQPASVEAWSYLASYADLRSVYGTDSAAAALHYNTQGSPREGRTITFDVYQYMAANTDLIRAFGTDFASAARHYVVQGLSENRATAFNAASYLAANTDLQAAFALDGNSANDVDQALHHYVTQGYWEISRGLRPDTSSSYDLQVGKDEKTANLFTSSPDFIPGTGFLTTLDDIDILTGIGTNPTLTVEIGTRTDFNSNDTIIQPTLNNIQTVKVAWTSDEVNELDLADADALKTLDVTRITVNNPTVSHTDLSASLSAITLSDATRGGDVSFISREEVLTGTTDVLAFGVTNARVHSVTLNEGGDGNADLGFYYETINMTSTASNDLDALTIGANTREDLFNGLASDTTTQTLNITAGGSVGAAGYLEINNLTANGLEFINITANHRVDIAADKLAALSSANDGITTNDLKTLTITGGANVMIDGLDTLRQSAGTVLTVNAGTMTGNLKLGVETGADSKVSNVSTLYVNHFDEDLKVTSGIGNDQIHVYSNLAGDITTGEGNDVVALIDGSSIRSAQSTLASAQATLAAALAVPYPVEATVNAASAAVSAATSALTAALAATVIYADAEGVSQIVTEGGNDTVTAHDLLVTASDKDLADNGGFDDVTAASISTGLGDDTVTVRRLLSGPDWDNITLTDTNKNDQQLFRGASISTGAGADTVVFSLDLGTLGNGYGSEGEDSLVAEGALVDAGSENDVVSFGLTTAGITLAADTDADVETLVTATNGRADNHYTDEVSALGVVDRLGAIVDLGLGSADVINFTETDYVYLHVYDNGSESDTYSAEETTLDSFTIVGRDAEVRGAETMNVTALDYVAVDAPTTMTDQDHTKSGDQTDINVNVIGTQILNLTVANQIEDTNTTDGFLRHGTNSFNPVNDDDATDGEIDVDVMRFDSALTAINLHSEEKWLQTGPAVENYEAGTSTNFVLNNMREGVALTLTAFEATGVTGGALVDDTQLEISTFDGDFSTDSSATDVNLLINYDGARDLSDAAALTIAATDAFDLSLEIHNHVFTDTVGDGASTTDDDTTQVENFTLTFSDAFAHSVDMNGFGDLDFRVAPRLPLVAGDVSSTADTSFNLNTGAGAGEGIEIDNINADHIHVHNAAGTGVTAANVSLRVDSENNYDIITGSGNDIISMSADDVRSDDTASALNRADSINAGEGRDTMIINGSDDLGTNNNAGVSPSMIVNDDVFMHLDSIETILIDACYSSSGLMITLDEQAGTGAGNTNVDTIRLFGHGGDDDQLDLLIGNNFTVASTVNTTNIAGGALLIDASDHLGETVLNIESKDDDTDIQFVNMDIRVAASGGTHLSIVDSGAQSAQVEVRVYTADETDIHVIGSSAGGGNSDGEVEIHTGYAGDAATLAAGAFDKLVLVEGSSHDDGGAEGAMTITIDSRWTNDTTGFTLDASAIEDTDASLSTGGARITVDSGDLAALTIQGTQNSDSIVGGWVSDLINGNAGNDTIVGGEVVLQNEVEVVTFGTSYDAGDVITVTHNGNTITATIIAGGVTGATVAAAFAAADGGTDTVADNITMTGLSAFTSATSVAATNNLRLTGTPVGIDYTVTATTNNTNDNVAVQQTLSIVVTDGGDWSITVQWNGDTYALSQTGGGVLSDPQGLNADIVAAGGTFTHTTNPADGFAGTELFTIVGLASNSAFPVITGHNIVSGVVAGGVTTAITVLSDMKTDQANPTVATETFAYLIHDAADVINGGAGDDVIAGLTGADTLNGGAGNDTLDYHWSLSHVHVDLTSATAHVVSGGDAEGDVASYFEHVLGSSYDDVLTGSSDANWLSGGAGADTISGAAGADTIIAGEGLDVVDGGLGIDTISLTETLSVQDTVKSDVLVVANADLISGFVSGTDKFQYSGTLLNGSGNTADGSIAGTDVIRTTTFELGLANANAHAGIVFIATDNIVDAGSSTQGTAFTTLLGSSASTLAANYAAFEAELFVSGGALTATHTEGLDAVLGVTDSALLVLDNSTGSVVLHITNPSVTVVDTLTAADVELVGVFVTGQDLLAADFI